MGVVEDNTWKPIHSTLSSNHYHEITVAALEDYLICTNRRNRGVDINPWQLVRLRDPCVLDENGEPVCFYCELAMKAVDIKFAEIQQLYIDAHAQAKDDHVNCHWSQLAQRFYDEKLFACHLKPAKQ